MCVCVCVCVGGWGGWGDSGLGEDCWVGQGLFGLVKNELSCGKFITVGDVFPPI